MSSHDVVLADRYRLDGQIAAGAVGEVWRGLDVVLERPVAVKLLRAEFSRHADTLLRFRAEAKHAGSLSHPNIAHVYDYCEPDELHPPFLVMELVDGQSLAGLLTAGPLDAAQVMDVIAQAATGLHAAHQTGLVHRDIKPSNLLLNSTGLVKITDFGIAHAAGSAPITRTGTVIGTPAYLAPERVAGSSATPASDLYSLGVVAFECLTGAPPFAGSPLEVALAHRHHPFPPLPPTVPAEVAALVTALVAKEPPARPGGARQVAAQAGQLRDALTAGAASLEGSPRWSSGATLAEIPLPGQPGWLSPESWAGRAAQAGRTGQADDPGWQSAAGKRTAEPPLFAGEQPLAAEQLLAGHEPPQGRHPARQPTSRGSHAAPPPPPSRPPGSRHSPPQSHAGPQAGRRVSRRRTRMSGLPLALVATGVLGLAVVGILLVALPGKHPPQRQHLASQPSPVTRTTSQAPRTPSTTPHTSKPSTSPTTTPTVATMVDVNGGSLVGQSVQVAFDRLHQLGLQVQVRWQRSDTQPPGTVLAVTPAGRVAPGSVVTVTVAIPPHHHHHGPGSD